MLKAIINDAVDAVTIARRTGDKKKNWQKELEMALDGLVGKDRKIMLSLQLKHIGYMNQQQEELNQEIIKNKTPYWEDDSYTEERDLP